MSKNTLKLLGRCCRLTCGATLTRAQEASAQAALAFAAGTAAQVQQQPAGKTGIAKLLDCTDQGNSDEVPTVTGAVMVAAMAKYKLRMGDVPTEDFEPSIEQHTGVVHLLSLRSPPYALP